MLKHVKQQNKQQICQNLSKGILQEGHKELIGEASPTAPPSDGVPGKNWWKTNQPSFCHFCWQWKRWVFGHLWDTDCVHTTAPLPQLRPPALALEWGNSRIGECRRDFWVAHPEAFRYLCQPHNTTSCWLARKQQNKNQTRNMILIVCLLSSSYLKKKEKARSKGKSDRLDPSFGAFVSLTLNCAVQLTQE